MEQVERGSRSTCGIFSVSAERAADEEKETDMTIIGHKVTGRVAKEHTGYGIGTYFTVGLAAMALGVGVVWASVQFVGSNDVSAAQQAAVTRGELVDENLESLFRSGLAQQAAARQAAQLQSRIESGLAQQAAVAAAAEQAAIEASPFEGRIESGLAQQAAIASAESFGTSWDMRGTEMANHLDSLVTSGLAQKAAINNS